MKRLKTKLQLNKSTIIDVTSPKSIMGGSETQAPFTKLTERTYYICPPIRKL